MTHRIDRRRMLAAAGAAPVLACQARLAVAQALTRVRLTAGANIGYSHQYVGEATGIFRKHNIDASVILFDVGFLGTEAVVAGQAETAGTVEFPLVGLLSRGADLVVPAIMITADDLKIVALKSIEKPGDLAGKRIAFIFGSSAHYALYRYCLRHGIGWDQIKPVNVPAAEQVAVIKDSTQVPVCVGFGVSNPEQAAKVASMADGVVVGSAIVKLIEKNGTSPDLAAQVEAFVKPLVDAVHALA